MHTDRPPLRLYQPDAPDAYTERAAREITEIATGTRFMPSVPTLIHRIEQGLRTGECVDALFFMLPNGLLDRKRFVARFSTGMRTEARRFFDRCCGLTEPVAVDADSLAA